MSAVACMCPACSIEVTGIVCELCGRAPVASGSYQSRPAPRPTPAPVVDLDHGELWPLDPDLPEVGALVPPQQASRSAPALSQESAEPVRPPGVVVGTVIDTRGPSHMRPRINGWKGISYVLLLMALGPLFLVVWAAMFAFRILLMMMGFKGLASHRGLLEGLLFHHLLGRLGRPGDQVPVYHHRLELHDETGSTVLVRQEGEFRDGCILVGNTLQVRGPRKGGTIQLRGGFNESLGARLSMPINPWKPAAFILFLVVLFEYLAAFAWMGTQGAF